MKNSHKKRGILLVILILSFLINSVAFAAPQPPTVEAQSAILTEVTTGKILYEKDIHKKMYPASMTKILTALVTLDYFAPEALITVGTEINEVSLDSSKAGHVVGETLSTENLIRGLIIPSGNDTANVLASAVAKKVKNDETLSYAECEKIFSDLMNEKAKALGANESHFSNPHGYHDDNHYTTAYDMSLIAAEAMKNETIRKIAAEKSFSGNGAGNTLENSSTLKTENYNWKSHNLLLTPGEYYYEYANGLKTGFTDEAGDCLAATAVKDNEELIAVIFHSEDPARWNDAKSLFEYGFNNFSFEDLQKNGDVVDTVQLTGHNRLNGDTLDAIVKENITDFISSDDISKVEKVVKYSDSLIAENKKEDDKTVRLKAPIEKDAEIGTVTYQLNGDTIKEAKIYAANAVEKNTVFSSIKFFFKNTFSNLFSVKGLLKVLAVIIIIVVIIIIINLIRKRRKRSRSHYRYSSKLRRR